MFGIGSQAYGANFNAVARAFDKHLASLGGIRIMLRGEGNVDEGTVDQHFDAWSNELLQTLKSTSNHLHFQESTAEILDELQANRVSDLEPEAAIAREDVEESVSDDDSDVFEDATDNKENLADSLVDLEDVAGLNNRSQPSEPGNKRGVVRKQPSRKVLPSVPLTNGTADGTDGPKEMVTPALRANLEKQVCTSVHLSLVCLKVFFGLFSVPARILSRVFTWMFQFTLRLVCGIATMECWSDVDRNYHCSSFCSELFHSSLYLNGSICSPSFC